MLRLILREERHSLRKEYFLRLAIVCATAAIALMVIWAFVLLSLYTQVRTDKRIATDELASIQDSDLIKDKEEARRLSGLVTQKINYLSPEIFEPGYFIDIIIGSQNAGITLNRFNIDLRDQLDDKKRKTGKIAFISINGVAKSRSDLVDFQKTLDDMGIFAKVEAPYSSFASNSDLPFDMTIQSVELIKYFAGMQDSTIKDTE